MSFLSGAPQVLPFDNIDGLPRSPARAGFSFGRKDMKGDFPCAQFWLVLL